MKYFVWITGIAGPEPQLWAEMQVDGSGKHKPYLACHAIAADDNRTLGELRRDFKYEEISI